MQLLRSKLRFYITQPHGFIFSPPSFFPPHQRQILRAGEGDAPRLGMQKRNPKTESLPTRSQPQHVFCCPIPPAGDASSQLLRPATSWAAPRQRHTKSQPPGREFGEVCASSSSSGLSPVPLFHQEQPRHPSLSLVPIPARGRARSVLAALPG